MSVKQSMVKLRDALDEIIKAAPVKKSAKQKQKKEKKKDEQEQPKPKPKKRNVVERVWDWLDE